MFSDHNQIKWIVIQEEAPDTANENAYLLRIDKSTNQTWMGEEIWEVEWCVKRNVEVNAESP